MGALLAVRAARLGVVNLDGPTADGIAHALRARARGVLPWPYEGKQCIDDVFGQPVGAEPFWIPDVTHQMSFLNYLS